eukprot:scaffold1846_cov203-Ochromonas_danica.AAC.1
MQDPCELMHKRLCNTFKTSVHIICSQVVDRVQEGNNAKHIGSVLSNRFPLLACIVVESGTRVEQPGDTAIISNNVSKTT